MRAKKLQEANAGNPQGKWTALAFALVPVAEMYEIRPLGIGLGKIILAVLLLKAFAQLARGRRPRTTVYAPMIFVTFLSAVGVLVLITGYSDSEDLNQFGTRSLVLMLWALSLWVTASCLFDPERVSVWVIRLAVLATIYLSLQVVLWRTGHWALPNMIATSFLGPVADGYADAEALGAHYDMFFHRPAGFFAEPQYYADYATLALVLLLFARTVRFGGLLAVLLTVGIILSTSTTGLILAAAVWAVYILSRVPAKLPPTVWIAIPCLLGVGSAWLTLSGLSESLGASVMKIETLDETSRVGGSIQYLAGLQGVENIVGVGIGLEGTFTGDSYYNSFVAIGLGAGVVGIAALLFMWSALLAQARVLPGRFLIGIYILLSVGGSALYADRSVLLLAFALLAGASFWQRTPRLPTSQPNTIWGT